MCVLLEEPNSLTLETHVNSTDFYCCYYSKICDQLNMKNWFFQLSIDMSTFGNKAALWWWALSVFLTPVYTYYLEITLATWLVPWLAPWLSPSASLRTCFMLEMRGRIGKK